MNEWIPVEKEFPELGQYIIVSDGRHVGEAIFAPKNEFITLNNWTVQPWGKITHWISLPKPPRTK